MGGGPENLPEQKLSWRNSTKELWSRCLKASKESSLSFRDAPWRLLLVAIGFLVALFFIYWIFEKIFIYFVARSYVQEIADVFDLNKHLASAIVYLTFVAIAIFGAMTFRFSRQKTTHRCFWNYRLTSRTLSNHVVGDVSSRHR